MTDPYRLRALEIVRDWPLDYMPADIAQRVHREQVEGIAKALRKARREALEEAARDLEAIETNQGTAWPRYFANRVRALADEEPEKSR